MKSLKTNSLKLTDTNTLYFTIGDVHGHHKELKKLISIIIKNYDLNKINYKFIFLGDYIDRGPSCSKTLDYIMEINKKYNCHFLLGNHEYYFLKTDKFYGPTDISQKDKLWIKKFISTHFLLWIETSKFLFIHGGPKTTSDLLDNINPESYLSNYDPPVDGWNDKIIVRGHKAVDEVTVDNKLISVETHICCTSGGGHLSCAVLNGDTGSVENTFSVFKI